MHIRSIALIAASVAPVLVSHDAPARTPAPQPLPSPPGYLVKAAALGDHKQTGVPKKYRKLSRSIGLLVNNRGGYCTAFCLKANVIGTAAHCLDPIFGKQKPKLAGFRFRLSGKGSTRIAGVNALTRRLSTIVGTTRVHSVGRSGEHDQRHYDWALVRLQKPLCSDRGLQLANISSKQIYSTDSRFISIFHQTVKGRRRARFSNCDVSRKIGKTHWFKVSESAPFPGDFFLHNCDIKPGGSGAPVIWIDDEGPKVIGIQSGYLDFEDKKDTNFAIHARTIIPYVNRLASGQDNPSRELIIKVQELLKSTGDYRSSIDGVYGRGTRQALLDFTIRHSLPIPIDRPIQELLPILRKHRTSAPFPEMINAFEIYLYHPHMLRHKAFAVKFDAKKWGYSYGGTVFEYTEREALNWCDGPVQSIRPSDGLCELYAVNDRILGNGEDRRPREYFVPETSAFQRLVQRYKNSKGVDYKAAAVDRKTRTLHTCEDQPSLEEAMACALNRCIAHGDTCHEFAIGNKVIFGLSEQEADVYGAYYRAVLD